MAVLMKKIVIACFAILVCVCVYLHGTNSRFSIESYILNIVGNFEEPPHVFSLLVFIWTDDGFRVTDSMGSWGATTTEGETADAERKNFFESVVDWFVGVWNGFLRVVVRLFGETVTFVRRVAASIGVLVEFWRSMLANSKLFYPWNAIVPRGA